MRLLASEMQDQTKALTSLGRHVAETPASQIAGRHVPTDGSDQNARVEKKEQVIPETIKVESKLPLFDETRRLESLADLQSISKVRDVFAYGIIQDGRLRFKLADLFKLAPEVISKSHGSISGKSPGKDNFASVSAFAGDARLHFDLTLRVLASSPQGTKRQLSMTRQTLESNASMASFLEEATDSCNYVKTMIIHNRGTVFESLYEIADAKAREHFLRCYIEWCALYRGPTLVVVAQIFDAKTGLTEDFWEYVKPGKQTKMESFTDMDSSLAREFVRCRP